MSLINQMLKDLEHRGAGAVDVKTNSTPLLNTPTKKSSKQITYLLFGLLAIIAATVYINFLPHKKQEPMNNADTVTTMPTVTINDAPMTPAPEVKLDTLAAPMPESTPATAISAPSIATSSIAISDPLIKADNTQSTEVIPASTSGGKIKASKKTAPVAEVKTSAQFETSLKYNSSAQQEMTAENIEAAKLASEKKSAKTDRSAGKSNQTISIHKEIKPEQKSIASHQQALLKLQQGRVTEAQADLTQALEFNPVNHEARLTYASLLLDNKRHSEAKDLLAKGLMISPEQNDFRIALARLQVDAGDPAALNTLEEGQSYANNNADYQSFFAAMLQRANRHDDAIEHYKAALALTTNTPNNSTASTLIGLGISLQATEQLEDAKQAFTRVKQNYAPSPELAQFVEQRLKQINQRLQH